METPVRPDYENFLDLPLSPFPISREGQLFNLLNIHYLNLNRLPALKLPQKHEKLQWMFMHLALAFSENEEIARENSTLEDSGSPLVNLKESITTIFFRWVEKSSENVKSRFHPLGPNNPNDKIGVYTLIFVNDTRFDLASHTIVADACVIPLSQKNVSKLSLALGRAVGIRHVLINTPDEETKLWKLFLPALAERCRTWKHLPTCEYLSQGIPACTKGLGFEASPLCSCGKGRILASLERGLNGRNFIWRQLELLLVHYFLLH